MYRVEVLVAVASFVRVSVVVPGLIVVEIIHSWSADDVEGAGVVEGK
jgi:hypothetical protein